MAKCENESVWGNPKKAFPHTKLYSDHIPVEVEVGQSGIKENPLSTAGVIKIMRVLQKYCPRKRAQLREWRFIGTA